MSRYWSYALVGAATATVVLPAVLGYFIEVGFVTGPVLALSVGIAASVRGKRRVLAWWQLLSIAVLYPLAQVTMLSLAPSLPVKVGGRQMSLGPDAGLVLADMITVVGVRLLLRRSAVTRFARGLWVVCGLFAVTRYGALLGSVLITGPATANSVYVGVSVVTTAAIFCGYVGYVEGGGSNRGTVKRDKG